MRAWTDISLPSRHRTPPHQPTPIPVPSALSRADRPSPSPSTCAPPLSSRHGGHAGVLLPSLQWRDTQRVLTGVPCDLVRTPSAEERSTPSSPETGGSCGRGPCGCGRSLCSCDRWPCGRRLCGCTSRSGRQRGGEGVKMRQPGAAMRLMILLQRPLSRGLRGQMACASPPMFFKTILMTSWGTTISYSIVCHTRLWTTTCARGAHQGPVELPTPSTQWRSPASTYSRRKPIAATPAVSRSALTARISMRVMCVTPLAIAFTGSPACRQPTGCCFLG